MFWKDDVGVISKPSYSEDEFLWTLPNCFSCLRFEEDNENRQCVLCSPLFSFFNVKWRLVLIRNRLQIYDECVGLFLWKISSTNCLPDVTIELGMKLKENSEKSVNGELNSYGCFGKWNFERSASFYDAYNEYSRDGFLRLFCKFQTKENKHKDTLKCENEEGKQNENDEDNIIKEIPESKGIDKLSQDLKKLLLNGQNSDVILNVQDRQFKSHKNILIVRSPVFASMLQHDTKENATGVVDIPDCSAEAFEEFLSYVYTGNLDTISSENVFDLY